MAKVRRVICGMRSPVAVDAMEGTLMVRESAVTCSMTPVVIPHTESQPCFGGKVVQSQVDADSRPAVGGAGFG